MSTVKEALAALDELHDGVSHKPGDRARLVHTVRIALEAAQREAEAWEAIEAWCATWKQLTACVNIFWLNGRCCVALGPFSDAHTKEFEGATRLEAIESAAEWCRAQVTK